MRLGIKLVFAASIALILLPGRAAFAASQAPADDKDKEKEKVLQRLNIAAAKFRSTSADVEFDNVQTDPIYNKDIDKGTVYYQRKGSGFQMAAHLREENGKPVPKVYVYSGGTVKLYEKLINQVTTLSKFAQYQSWFELGFGAGGKDLEQKWDIKYLGPETIDGVRTEKLELTPKDPAVKKNVPKVIVWMDPDRGVSVKQLFDEGQGQSRTCLYSNIKVNQSLPSDAFTFKTDPNPTYVNR
jgi:outer membrane lipoprotein-sorting protein